MKLIESRDDDFNVYLTEADYSPESTAHTDPTELFDNVKLFSLLGEHVVLAAAHVYESPQTIQLLQSNPVLLETGLVVVDLREDCRDFSDFLESQRVKKPEDGLWNSREMDSVSAFLNEKCPSVLKWSPSTEEGIFRDLLVASLLSKESTLRKRMVGVRTTAIDEAAKRISDTPRVTRSFLKEVAKELFPQRMRVLMEEVNAAYYLAGAKDMNLIPALHPDYFNKCENGLYHIRQDHHCREMIKDLFAGMLGTKGLRRDSVSQLSVEGVQRIREDKIVSEFRNAWWGITRSSSTAEGVSRLREYEQEVMHRIRERLRQEEKTARRFDKGEKAVGACSLAASGLSLLPNPVLALISFALALVSHPAVSGAVREKTAPGEFSVLCAKINENVVRNLLSDSPS